MSRKAVIHYTCHGEKRAEERDVHKFLPSPSTKRVSGNPAVLSQAPQSDERPILVWAIAGSYDNSGMGSAGDPSDITSNGQRQQRLRNN